jgi:hypothetical protein
MTKNGKINNALVVMYATPVVIHILNAREFSAVFSAR